MDFYEQYKLGIIPHIHVHEDKMRCVFEDALVFQGKRIKKNIEKYFPEKSYEEIRKIMFSDIED